MVTLDPPSSQNIANATQHVLPNKDQCASFTVKESSIYIFLFFLKQFNPHPSYQLHECRVLCNNTVPQMTTWIVYRGELVEKSNCFCLVKD